MNRGKLILLAALGAVAASFLIAQPAQAKAITGLEGGLATVRQNSATHALILNGYAYDPAHRGESVVVSVWVDGHRVTSFHTTTVSKTINRRYHLTGAHAFHKAIRYGHKAHAISLLAHPAHTTKNYDIVSRHKIVQTSPAWLVVARAKTYVGRSPYVYGGSSPSGFDCSGFAMYVYKRAGMRLLPHNAESQRRSSHMRLITRAHARPGDLVFYLSGGYAYHVAVYAGHGRQYAAVMPGERIRYQATPHGVQFGTDWH